MLNTRLWILNSQLQIKRFGGFAKKIIDMNGQQQLIQEAKVLDAHFVQI